MLRISNDPGRDTFVGTEIISSIIYAMNTVSQRPTTFHFHADEKITESYMSVTTVIRNIPGRRDLTNQVAFYALRAFAIWCTDTRRTSASHAIVDYRRGRQISSVGAIALMKTRP